MEYVQDISSIFFVGMLNSIAMYPSERAIFYHEDADNTYPLEAIFIYYSTYMLVWAAWPCSRHHELWTFIYSCSCDLAVTYLGSCSGRTHLSRPCPRPCPYPGPTFALDSL